MKWFKHMSDANTDDKLVSIRARFGLWGIGAYWTLVELVCVQMQSDNPKKAEATFVSSELAAAFGCKRAKLISFLDHLQNIHAINSSLQGQTLVIEIPRLFKSLDNYHSGFKVSSKPSTSVSTSALALASEDKNRIQELVREQGESAGAFDSLAPIQYCRKHDLEHTDAFCPMCVDE
jgi:hypothetical protein